MRKAKYKYEIGQRVLDEKKDIIITDRRKSPITGKKEYLYRCNICGYDSRDSYLKDSFFNELWTEEYYIENRKLCSCCAGKVIKTGINDIATTDKWMINYFKDKTECNKLSKCSNKKVVLICPFCKREKINKICDFYRRHSFRCICSDNISYPEKTVFCFLEYFNFDFDYQYVPDWIKKTNEIKNFLIYDFHIKINEIDIIVETHGSQHYQEEFSRMGGRTLKEEQENDKLKKRIAYMNGYSSKTYFEINCTKSDFDIIINQLLNIKYIQQYVKYNKEDLNNIFMKTLDNMCKKICTYYTKNINNNNFISCKEIGKAFNISEWRVLSYLHIGTKIGWCNYNPKTVLGKKKLKTIYVYRTNGTYIGMRKGITNVSNELNISNEVINDIIKHKKFSYKGYIFTTEKNKIHKREECKNENRKQLRGEEICCFDKFNNLIKRYDCIKDAELDTGINHTNISKSCRKNTIAGGFFWKYKKDCLDLINITA